VWAATDFVLVISATANALTAVAALALPAIISVRDKQREEGRKKFDRAYSDVEYIISNLDRLQSYLGSESMRLAFMESGATAPDQDLEGSATYYQFQAAARRLAVLSRLVGVDSSQFELVLAQLVAHRPKFTATALKLQFDGDEKAQQQHYAQLAVLSSRCVDAATIVLKGLESKLA
jgi:hypothetical protein